jgi:Uma2 family endonuclease
MPLGVYPLWVQWNQIAHQSRGAEIPMATVRSKPRESTAENSTVADLIRSLGNVPAQRVRIVPSPGTATESDLLAINEDPFRTSLCELVAGTLVEKPMGIEESEIALLLGAALVNFARPRKLGMLLAPDGMLRLMPGLVRAPDISFISRESYPDGKKPTEPIAPMAPDLAVEILSKSNSRTEMNRKLREYFDAGTRLVWYVDPRKMTIRVYASPSKSVTLGIADHLDGGAVLPGFRMAVRELFERD